MATLKELCDLVQGRIDGDPDLEITGVSEIRNAAPGTITFLHDPRYRKHLNKTRASAVVVSRNEQVEGVSIIRVDNPALSFAKILDHFAPSTATSPGVHSTAMIGRGVKVGNQTSIGAYAVIDDEVVLADEVVIGSHSLVGRGSMIGAGTELKPQVIIYPNCLIGKNVLIHSGTTVGTDGYGFVTAEGIHHKVPQVGRVVIEDDVEIGANCTIDRGTIGDTIIGEGSKLDNLVHIAHNVKLGKGCLVTAQVGIAGSTIVGDYVAFGGQSGVTGHVEVGSHAQVAAKAGITKSVPGNKTYAGMPAREIREKNRVDALVRRLPDLMKKVSKLESEISQLKEKH